MKQELYDTDSESLTLSLDSVKLWDTKPRRPQSGTVCFWGILQTRNMSEPTRPALYHLNGNTALDTFGSVLYSKQ